MLRQFFYILFFLLLAFLYSCKLITFNISCTGADIPPEAKTISINTFPNNAEIVQPALSQFFTESLKDKFLGQTGLELVNNNGDLQIDGEITGYSVQPVAIQSNETAALNRLTIRVKVIYINTIEPDKNFEQSFSRYVDYDSSLDLASIEEDKISEINEMLVEDIFNRAVINW